MKHERRKTSIKTSVRMTKEEEQPLSPMARVFQSPGIDYCAVTIFGFKTKIRSDAVLDALKHNVYKHPRFSSKLTSIKTSVRMTKEEEQPLSPMARVFQSPGIDYCAVTIFGFKTKIRSDAVLDALKHNVYKHPRFSSKLSNNGAKWIKTQVNIEDHVIAPYIDQEEIGDDGESFVDDYITRLTMNPLDRSRPLWDIHILNVKTSDAESVAVVRTHHTLGDATSMVSLLLACTNKTSDPNRSSTIIPSLKRRERYKNKGWFLKSMYTIGSTMKLVWNTVVDVLLLVATMVFCFKDTKTHFKGGPDVLSNPKRFYHRTISLDDIKLIKNVMNMTINDVMVAITQASLSSYLNQLYDNKTEEDGALIPSPNNLPGGIRFRAGCTVNLRSEIGFKPLADMMAKDSKCRWGNYFCFITLPFSIGLQTDPLVYLKISKSMMDRKKHSYHAYIAYFLFKIGHFLIGAKAVAILFNRVINNTTTCLSNVMGPLEEISFNGNPIVYIAPSGYGHSQALLIHYMSYADKMTISLAVDPTIIPDPHKICDGMEESLKAMKAALCESGLL